MTPLEVGQRRRWQGLPTKWDLPHGAEGLEFIVTKVGEVVSFGGGLGAYDCEGTYINETSMSISQTCLADKEFFEKYSVVV